MTRVIGTKLKNTSVNELDNLDPGFRTLLRRRDSVSQIADVSTTSMVQVSAMSQTEILR